MAFKIENGVLKEYREEKGVTEIVIPDGVTSINVINLTSWQKSRNLLK